jgi:iron complex transport system substrate-binding protein
MGSNKLQLGRLSPNTCRWRRISSLGGKFIPSCPIAQYDWPIAVNRFVSCWLLITLVCLTACRRFDATDRRGQPTITIGSSPATNLTGGCADRYDPNVDYFPEKVEFLYAKQLRVSYHGNYKVVDFSPTVHTQETFRYVLVQCGTPTPTGYTGAHVIEVPAGRFVLNDNSYGSVVVKLGILDRLVGVISLLAYTTPEILARGRAGLVQEVGSRSHSSLEPTLAVDPDLVFLFYSAYPNANLHPQLRELGVEGAPLAGHFEPHPLGRSEWVKFLALFFNRERRAEELFEPAAARYEDMARRAADSAQRPEVLLGFPTSRDVWTLSGGRNFMARLVWDAGGHYFWQDQEAASLVTADYERVLDEALPAGVWLGGYGVTRVGSRQKLVGNDPRLAFFTPVERDRVYAADRGMDERMAIPFADQSLDKPDVVLADIAAALHPESLPGRQPVFFRKLR